jgi:hypothetical protein
MMLTRADWIIVAAAMALLPVLYGLLWSPAAPADTVEVRVADREVARIQLDHDQRLEIQGLLGPSEIEVRDGRVRFLHSPCDGKTCVLSGWHVHGGDIAACLPNRVSLQVVSRNARFDALNY